MQKTRISLRSSGLRLAESIFQDELQGTAGRDGRANARAMTRFRGITPLGARYSVAQETHSQPNRTDEAVPTSSGHGSAPIRLRP